MKATPRPGPSLLLVVLAGVALYALFLLFSAPAWLIDRLNERVSLDRPQGTLWRGSAEALRIATAPDRALAVRQVRWQVLPLRLFSGELALRVESADKLAQGVVAARPGGLALREFALSLPAAALSAAFPVLEHLKPDGTVVAQAADFALGREGASGEAQLDWRGATLAGSPVNPLGEYRLTVTGHGPGAELRLSTLGGALQLAGEGRWTPPQGLQFTGTAQAAPAFRQRLEPWLKRIGQDQDGGVYRIELRLP